MNRHVKGPKGDSLVEDPCFVHSLHRGGALRRVHLEVRVRREARVRRLRGRGGGGGVGVRRADEEEQEAAQQADDRQRDEHRLTGFV